MVRETEAWFTLRDGTRLFEKTWEPSSTPNAHLIFLHGFSDRSEIHYHLFPTLASEPYNIACHAIDQRGWGRSVLHQSQRGLTGPTGQVLTDIDEYINHVATQKIADHQQRPPLFLMGHSMGGQQVLHYLLSTNSSFTTSRHLLSGAILEAPYIALDPTAQPSTLLIIAGKLAAMVSPKSQMKQDLNSKYITRDPTINQAWKDDPLCHDYGTLEGLRDMLNRADRLVRLSQRPKGQVAEAALGLSRRLPVPVFWAHGTADRITAFEPSKKLFDVMEGEDLVFRAYEDAYHKIHAEPDGIGIAFSRDVAEWVLAVVEKEANGGRAGKVVSGREGDTGPQGDQGMIKAKL